ncbi:hypothetical protein [Blastococcus sp. LR1]|uniref:hypothetical protein n=1 Tax=Blastococcus sp. LR1 TaxID=2877000 RepID=UPI001CCE118C|nr:hypothetical protein [Blastococcus sp. LR1]MCA0144862.1 hypothetical protein [Blastococcus sp. LR1]
MFLTRARRRFGMVPLVAVVVVVVVMIAGVAFFVIRDTGYEAADERPPACDGEERTVTAPFPPGTELDEQWEEQDPPDDVTYDLTGVTSTAYPATRSVFEVGDDFPAMRTCVVGGTVVGDIDDDETWQYYHDEWNAGCVKLEARDWLQVRDVRCDGIEDGIVVKESADNANETNIYISGTYLTGIRDDCLENDYTIGGLLYDNLWEECHTGISERPWGDREWNTPEDETLTLDRMLIGLWETPNQEEGEKRIEGHNSIFKWSDSGGRVVIKCSIFKLESTSINGVDSMEMPPGTVVDDSSCEDDPSTIVWLGRGDYPGETAGMRVTKDEDVWDDAVAQWKADHDY